MYLAGNGAISKVPSCGVAASSSSITAPCLHADASIKPLQTHESDGTQLGEERAEVKDPRKPLLPRKKLQEAVL